MTAQEIRQAFLDFFKEKKHKIVPSAPMVLKDDPTLMFVNAGMNPFKSYFLGTKKPTHKRVADTQKCLRVSGKHNDLEEVGHDTYHHTFFEMLGNWSFGDYFKKEAIEWAWEFLTNVLKIDRESLYVTVFEGHTKDGLDFDKEAYDIWKNIVPESKILKGNKKDNFWEMGAQGPCGPCSEIHIDIRNNNEKATINGADLVNKDHPQVVEIWNLVFMEFNRNADGSLEKLPAKHVDTGMGFERLCMILQGVQSNYDTDIFTPIISEIEKCTGVTYGKNKDTDIAIRVIADHLRAVAFAIADGEIPSSNGAGYVIRRILRRAVRYGYSFLSMKQPFIYKLLTVLIAQMGAVFPSLKENKTLIESVLKEEEKNFLNTLSGGLQNLDKIISDTKNNLIAGDKVFELYDTFGFPIDLTALIAGEKGYKIDMPTFEKCLKAQKDRSKNAGQINQSDWVHFGEGTTIFKGYDNNEVSGVNILRYREINDKKRGSYFQVVLDKTPFYAEGGGQIGDTGILYNGHETVEIFDTKKENNEHLHFLKKLPQEKNNLIAKINAENRQQISAHHSATHLLHEALRTVLGNHVQQKGSLVQGKNLRFDFSHFAKVDEAALVKIEQLVNEKITKNIALKEHRDIFIDTALKAGAMALFGEKYGDKVRMIEFDTSKELCGGTHIKNTAQLWHFKIMSEGAVAAGVRRIEAIAGKKAKAHYINEANTVEKIKKILGGSGQILDRIEKLQSENETLKKEVTTLKKEKAKALKNDVIKEVIPLKDFYYLTKRVDMEAGLVKDVAYEIASEYRDENIFLFFGSKVNEKALLTCYISKNLVEKYGFDAGKIVRETSKYIQGGGGGQKFFATAGGKNPNGIKTALKTVLEIITA